MAVASKAFEGVEVVVELVVDRYRGKQQDKVHMESRCMVRKGIRNHLADQ